ncbi:MAG: xanthine dehydrogenase accessory protein XdhC [Robiginitomaculum sp.]|nr:xanthine dehydrogenase accessory protein XdhC [Robiginitomaculum sp.]
MKLTLKAEELLTDKKPAIVITLVEVQGSAPRNAGVKMLVWNDGQAGTIGGGELEFRLQKLAKEMLKQPIMQPVLQNFPLGPLLDQCCGGFVTAMLEPLVDHCFGDEKMSVQTCLSSGEKTLIAVNDDNAEIIITADKQYIIEPPCQKPPSIYLFGAGHIGAALAKILLDMDIDLNWIDNRPEMADLVQVCEDPVQQAKQAPDDALFVIVTHCHDLDYQLCRCILEKSQIRFCGLIGSDTKRARFVQRLQKDGISEKQIEQLTCPVGLDGIGGKHPTEIAVAIVGQLLYSTDPKSGYRFLDKLMDR